MQGKSYFHAAFTGNTLVFQISPVVKGNTHRDCNEKNDLSILIFGVLDSGFSQNLNKMH